MREFLNFNVKYLITKVIRLRLWVHLVSQIKWWLEFTKQMSSNWDEIWSKKLSSSWESSGVNLGLIRLIFIFSIFDRFRLFVGGICLSSMGKKAHGYNPHIFIFLTAPILWRNSTCSLAKTPYVNSEKVCLVVQFRIFFKMFSKGGGSLTQLDEPSLLGKSVDFMRLLSVRLLCVWLVASSLHHYVMRHIIIK